MIRKRLSKTGLVFLIINCVLVAVVVKFYPLLFWENAEKKQTPAIGRKLVEKATSEAKG